MLLHAGMNGFVRSANIIIRRLNIRNKYNARYANGYLKLIHRNMQWGKIMKDYKIEIKETLSRIVTILADSEADAITDIKEQYCKEGIVLDAADFQGVEFEVVT